MAAEATKLKLKPKPLKHQCTEKQSSSTHYACLVFSSLPIRTNFLPSVSVDHTAASPVSDWSQRNRAHSPTSRKQCDLMGSQSWTDEVHGQIIIKGCVAVSASWADPSTHTHTNKHISGTCEHLKLNLTPNIQTWDNMSWFGSFAHPIKAESCLILEIMLGEPATK